MVCKVLQVRPAQSNSYYDCKKHIQECDWFFIYDIIEGLYKFLYEKTARSFSGATIRFAEEINRAFVDQNIGRQLINGKIVMRGDEVFEETISTAVGVLVHNDKPTAADHLKSAIRALSERPKTNTAGAVSHATNAVECVLGDLTGEALTLGKYLDRYPTLFHPALKKALHGVYGYASDAGARHGKEWSRPLKKHDLRSLRARQSARYLRTNLRYDRTRRVKIFSVEDRDTFSDTERKAVAEADEWLRHNQPIPHDQVLAEFGLTLADWEKLATSTDS